MGIGCAKEEAQHGNTQRSTNEIHIDFWSELRYLEQSRLEDVGIRKCHHATKSSGSNNVIYHTRPGSEEEQSKIEPKIPLSSPKSSTYDGVSRSLDWSDSMGSADGEGDVNAPIVGVRGVSACLSGSFHTPLQPGGTASMT